MRLSAITLFTATATLFASSAFAQDAVHSCGSLPKTPELFDVDNATLDDVKAVAAAFNGYQSENTMFIDCLRETAKSDKIQGLRKKEKKAAMKSMDKELDETQQREVDYADLFNNTFKKWREKQLAAAQ